MVDAPFYLKFWVELTHPASKTAIFTRYWLVAAQPLELAKKFNYAHHRYLYFTVFTVYFTQTRQLKTSDIQTHTFLTTSKFRLKEKQVRYARAFIYIHKFDHLEMSSHTAAITHSGDGNKKQQETHLNKKYVLWNVYQPNVVRLSLIHI